MKLMGVIMENKMFMSAITVIALSLSMKPFNTKKEQPTPVEETIQQITTTTERQEIGITTAKGSPNLKKLHGYLRAEALLWNVLTDAADISLYTDQTSSNPVTHYNGYTTNNWGWNWGVKAAIGFDCTDDWDFSLNFAYLQAFANYNDQAYSASGVTRTIYPLSGGLEYLSSENRSNVNSQRPFSSFSQSNKFYFYDGSLLLARDFFVSKKLTLKPLAGAKGAYFKNTSDIDFTTSASSTSYPGSFSIKNNFWGVGPQIGSGIRFAFSRHFSLAGQVDGALLWGKVLNKEYYSSFTNVSQIVAINSNYAGNRYQMVPNINMVLGFVFDSNFAKNTKNIAFNISYENRYFFDNISTANITSRQKGSTSLQGLSTGLTFSY